MPQKISFKYRDEASTFFLWWKAIFLVPLWGIPVLGGTSLVVNQLLPQAVGYLYLVYVFSAIFLFVHDFRKQHLTIDQNTLVNGLFLYELPTLESVFLNKHKEGNYLQLVLVFPKKRVVFQMKRFQKGELKRFLQTLENKCPQVTLSPAVRKIITSNFPAPGQSDDELLIRISPHQFLEQMRSGFANTQNFWSENSFIWVFVLCSPIWSLIFYMLTFGTNSRGDKPLVYEISSALGLSISQGLYSLTTQGVNALCSLSKETWVGFIAFNILLVVLMRYAKIFLTTKCLQLDEKGILLKHEFSGIEHASTVRLLWEDAKVLRFESNVLHLTGLHDTQTISVDLSSLGSEKKTQLFSYLSKHLDETQMDTATQEALMPRQNMSYTELWLQSLTQSPAPQHLLPLQPGRTLNEEVYTVQVSIGAGGQGTAYLCTRKGSLQSKVVLKEIIFPVHVDSSIRKQNLERFESEANLLKNLSHENIVKLTDYFIEDHRAYLVLEYIEGQDLRTLASENKFDQSETLGFLTTICDALAYLHNQGIVHRDLSPDNFIKTKNGKIKLIDFEVSRKSDTGVTSTIVGKHAYISPEQFRGKTSSQSDIYSLGATVYFLLTGKDPEPISKTCLAEGDTGYGTILDSLIQKCTELDITKRFANVGEIQQWLADNEDTGTVIKTKNEREKEKIWLN